MNKLQFTLLATLGAVSAAPAWSAVDIGVGITIHQPGVYGRIEIGSQPPPPLIYAQPVIIRQPTVVVQQPQPLYLYVPPGHAKNWGKHCARYNACARPVYFVQETWVQERYEQENRGKDKGKDKGKNKDEGKGKKNDK